MSLSFLSDNHNFDRQRCLQCSYRCVSEGKPFLPSSRKDVDVDVSVGLETYKAPFPYGSPIVEHVI